MLHWRGKILTLTHVTRGKFLQELSVVEKGMNMSMSSRFSGKGRNDVGVLCMV